MSSTTTTTNNNNNNNNKKKQKKQKSRLSYKEKMHVSCSSDDDIFFSSWDMPSLHSVSIHSLDVSTVHSFMTEEDDDDDERRVRFSASEWKPHLCRKDYTKQEKKACFYTAKEFQTLASKREKLIQDINSGKKKKKKETKKNKKVPRGLEYWIHETSKYIDERVDALMDEVIEEQYQQTETGVVDRERLAEVAQTASQTSREVALKRAKRDEKEALEAYRNMWKDDFKASMTVVTTFPTGSTDAARLSLSMTAIHPRSMNTSTKQKRKRKPEPDFQTTDADITPAKLSMKKEENNNNKQSDGGKSIKNKKKSRKKMKQKKASTKKKSMRKSMESSITTATTVDAASSSVPDPPEASLSSAEDDACLEKNRELPKERAPLEESISLSLDEDQPPRNKLWKKMSGHGLAPRESASNKFSTFFQRLMRGRLRHGTVKPFSYH